AVVAAGGVEEGAVANLPGREHHVDRALARPGNEIVGEVRRRSAPEALRADLPPTGDGDELARAVVELPVLVLVAGLQPDRRPVLAGQTDVAGVVAGRGAEESESRPDRPCRVPVAARIIGGRLLPRDDGRVDHAPGPEVALLVLGDAVPDLQPAPCQR